MKKYIVLFAAAVLSLASCQKDQFGTMPGNDSDAFVTLSTFTPGTGYDSDSDVSIRMSANNVSTAVYYFYELTSDKEARKMGEETYADFVVKNGTKATVTESKLEGAQVADVVLQGLKGANTISVVAVGANGSKKLATAEFFGIDWQLITTGAYTFAKAAIGKVVGANTVEGVLLQQRADEPTTYRLKNVYGTGNHLILTSTGIKGEDSDGKFTLMRVAAQGIGGSYGSYGAVSVRDIGTWQGDDSYNTDPDGLPIWFYEDGSMYLYLQYYVDAGSLGYGCDTFVVTN